MRIRLGHFFILIFLIFFETTQLTLAGDWTQDFRDNVLVLAKLSRGRLYEYPQPSLKTLLATGKGDCVAWSKLMAKVAIKNKIPYKHYVLYSRNKEDIFSHHQISILESGGQMWLQSNHSVMLVDDMKEALTTASKQIAWEYGCNIDREVIIKEEDLYK